MFNVGDHVKRISGNGNVRSTPGGSVLGTMTLNSEAVVVAGPEIGTINGTQFWFYKLDLDEDPEWAPEEFGWVGDNQLALGTPLPPSNIAPLENTFLTGAEIIHDTGNGNVRASSRSVSTTCRGSLRERTLIGSERQRGCGKSPAEPLAEYLIERGVCGVRIDDFRTWIDIGLNGVLPYQITAEAVNG